MKKRAQTYHEKSRVRDRASIRKGLKNQMKLKQASFMPKTVQSHFGEDKTE